MPAPSAPRRLTAVIALIVAMALALVGALTAPAAASPEGDLNAAVARLQAKIDSGAGRLAAATARWETGSAALDRSLQTNLNAGFALDASRERVRHSQDAVNAFANSAYRMPMNPGVVGLFRGDLLAYHDFNIAQRGINKAAIDQQSLLTALESSRNAAEKLASHTGIGAAAAQRAQALLDDELEGLRVLAAQDQNDLSKAAAELAALRARYVPTGSTCSALPNELFANGFLPPGALCPLRDAPGQSLLPAAAASFDQLSAAYQQAFGTPVCVTDSYRDYASQVAVYRDKPSLAATPGRSRHGLGLAVDLCGGIQSFGTVAHRWMLANAGGFGFVHPAWAEPGGSKPEPWHWEFGLA